MHQTNKLITFCQQCLIERKCSIDFNPTPRRGPILSIGRLHARAVATADARLPAVGTSLARSPTTTTSGTINIPMKWNDHENDVILIIILVYLYGLATFISCIPSSITSTKEATWINNSKKFDHIPTKI